MKNIFGLFIHWGIYSLTEEHEQVFARRDMSRTEYEALMYSFDPILYDPEEWVKAAKAAGMKYICFTAKHHDGFCMWDTLQTDYNVMNTPYGRDVLKMLADACRKHGMKLSLYYSLPDWHEPSAYNPDSSHQWKAVSPEKSDSVKYRGYVKRQIKELLTNYGEIYSLFWDIPPKIYDPSINEYVRSLMPGIIINDRGYDEGDFSTPERNIPEGGRFEKMTEACQSVGLQSWGYNKDEDRFSPRYLMYSIDRIMARGGSYLLNVGPRPDGIIDESSRRALARIGKWYRSLEETMEDTEVCDIALKVLPSALPPSGEYLLFKKNGKVYIHFPSGLITDSFYLSECPYLLKRVRLMNNNTYLDIKQVCPISLINKVTGIADRAMTRISGIPWELLDSEPIALELTW